MNTEVNASFNDLREAVDVSAVYNVTKFSVHASISFMVPVGEKNSLITFWHQVDSKKRLSAGEIKKIADNTSRGFLNLANYIWKSATELDVPIYGLDLETNDRQVIGQESINLDRARIGDPKLSVDSGTGNKYLSFIKE
jgi:hypothetical protein